MAGYMADRHPLSYKPGVMPLVAEEVEEKQRQHAATILAPKDYSGKSYPSTDRKAACDVLFEAATCAGQCALYAAAVVRSRGTQAAIDHAEAAASIASNAATAVYAIASSSYAPSGSALAHMHADRAALGAEVAGAAVSAYRARSVLAALAERIPGTRKSVVQIASVYELDHAAEASIAAANTCVAAVYTVVPVARNKTMATVRPARGLQVLYDARLLPDLHQVSKMARAAAASASATSAALRTIRPDLAARTAQAASAATAASTEATVLLMDMLWALLPLLDVSDYQRFAPQLYDALTTFEAVGSNGPWLNRRERTTLMFMAWFTKPRPIPYLSESVAQKCRNGTIQVVQADSSCASDVSETASTATVASAPVADGENQPPESKKRKLA